LLGYLQEILFDLLAMQIHCSKFHNNFCYHFQPNLFDLIELGEKNFDEICELTQLPVEVLNLHLTELEFSGLIKQLPGRIYTLS